jgi:hypothetical protein
MTIRASGRSTLILATGLLVCFACPSQAAPDADDATANSKLEDAPGPPVALNKNLKHSWRHQKGYAHAKSHKLALKAAEDGKAAATHVAADSTTSSNIPPSVANAKAQLQSLSSPAVNPQMIPPPANDLPQALPDNSAGARPDNETLTAAADQLNDVDRSLREGNPPTPSANHPATPVMASSQESSTLDQTSLIGKIFIGFGALLTMASAARMFMA